MSSSIEAEMTNAVKKAFRIPGQIRQGEAGFLYKLARRRGNLVEIGCLHGRSTSILAQAAGMFKAHVTSIDPFVETPNTQKPSREFWRANLEKAELRAPELLEMTSHAASERFTREIAFLFIDGDHTYAGVVQDIQDWAPKIKIGGVIAFHDMFQPNIPGVAMAVSTWWNHEFSDKGARWECAGMVDFTVAFRRVS